MPILSFLVQLFGATMLLLFAVRMVRTGIERAFGASFERMITRNSARPLAAGMGVMLAIVLQSSAAVTLLVSSFSASGAIGFGPALAMVLGGDLGSALVIQVLSLRLDWLAPLLLAGGGFLFLKTQRKATKQAGRVILGVALILISLQLLRDAVDPIRDSSFLPAISAYLEKDFITAFLVGAALAFVMHSSVAAILMCVTIVSIGALPASVGLSLVLGANLGSGAIPVWLSRGADANARRIPLANLLLRGSAAILAVFGVQYLPLADLPQLNSAQGLILLHVLFNAALLIALPATHLIEAPMRNLLPDPEDDANAGPVAPQHRSSLDAETLSDPSQALGCMRREVLRMSDLVAEMLTPVMDLHQNFDQPHMRAIEAQDRHVNAALDGIRRFAAQMDDAAMKKGQIKDRRDLIDYAIALEATGDIIVKRLLPLSQEKAQKGIRFSDKGEAELVHIHARVLSNLRTASNVLIAQDVEGARLLMEEKAEMKRLERKSRKQHLLRLNGGDQDSLASSDVHIETAYLLKECNSWIATIAQPILHREGQLLETRLVQ